METILITGFSGLIAGHLRPLLGKSYSLRFLSENSRGNAFSWDVKNGQIDESSLDGVDHIIHLAGANIAAKRWSAGRKNEILESRVNSAELLLQTLRKRKQRIQSFIAASAVGYYGLGKSPNPMTETDPSGSDFLSDVVEKLESAADRFSEVAGRVVKVRTGMVLAPKGGALAKMALPVKLYAGAALGTGRQFIPWIHIEDLCRLYLFLIEHGELSGAFNAVAPGVVTNAVFMKTLATTLGKPMFLPNVPAWVLKLAMGEMAQVLLGGPNVSSEKVREAGFVFVFGNLGEALRSLLASEGRNK